MSRALESLLRLAGPGWIVIVGATATGKSALAVDAARALDGEIVSADSRLVYRGMDIATAKPTLEERGGIPHHGIDLVDPDAPWTLGDYLAAARSAIEGVESRGRRVIITGGTGLYVDALVKGYVLPPDTSDASAMPTLKEMLEELDKRSPDDGHRIDRKNARRVERALRYVRQHGPGFFAAQQRDNAPRVASLFGLAATPPVLEERVRARVDAMLREGLLDEARGLFARYPATLPSLSGIGYPEAHAHLEGRATLEETREAIVRATMRYAKRQRTWFKRNPLIRWADISADMAFS